MVNIITVAGDGTGDYNCDGTNDEVQINAALADAASRTQYTVLIKGSFTYDIQDTLQVGSYTTVQLEATARLRLKNSAAWAENKPLITQAGSTLENFEMYGGELDLNYANQTEALNSGYYPVFVFSNVTNLNVHDMNIHDGAGHGLQVTTGTNIIFHSNTIKNLGGDACYLITSTTCDIYSNNITVRGNSAVHIKDTKSALIHNNFINGLDDDETGGIACVIIEDTQGKTEYPTVYENVILDAVGSGIKLIESGTGYTNRNKHAHVHHNVVRGCGRSRIRDDIGGCTVHGFDGAIFEYNNFDGNYNCGFYSRYPTQQDGYGIHCRNNTVSNTHHHRNESYRDIYSGHGFSNRYPTKYTMYLENNLVFNSESGNYYGCDGTYDVPNTPTTTKYIPPTTYIQDEVQNYYVEGHTAYINGYPFRWQKKKISLSKSVGQQKPPGIDGWAIEDFGFGGAEISLDCYAYSLDEMRQVIAAFYKPGRSILELGGLYTGYRVTGIAVKHTTDLQLTHIIPEHTYPYNLFFLCDKPIMESNQKKIRTKKLTDDQQTWNCDDWYPGNLVKNHDFHTWDNKTITMSWATGTSAADNNWESVVYAAATGTSTTTVNVGDEPTFCALNPAGTFLYVCNGNGSTVSKINTSTNAVTSITVGTRPKAICIDSNGTYAYVTNYNSNSISRITLADNTVSSISVGTNPYGIAITPDNSKVYVANKGGNSVSVVTTSNFQVSKTISSINDPTCVAVSPNGSYVYISDQSDDRVYRINPSTDSSSGYITTSYTPTGLAFTSDSAYCYAACYDQACVDVINTSTNQVTRSINVGSNPFGICGNSDTSKFYVTNSGSSNNVSVITKASNTVTSTIAAGTTPYGISCGSTKLFIANSAADTVSVVDFSVTGKFVAVSSSGNNTSAMTSADGVTWATKTTPVNTWKSVCFASSLNLLVAVGNSGSLNRVMSSGDVGETWVSRTTPAGDQDWRAICWCPGITKFVAVAASGTYRAMYSANGTSSWTLTSSSTLAQTWSSVCWSPELTLAVAVAYTGTTQQVMTSSNGTSWTARNTPLAQAWTSVCWSPDLTLFCAVSENGSTQQVMTSPDGTNWTARDTPLALQWQSVVWDDTDKCFVAVANSGTGKRCMTSLDGKLWKIQSTSDDNNWESVCYASSLRKFVAVASSGSGNRVMTCSNISTASLYNCAPTDWDYHCDGQWQSDDCWSDISSYQIRGDGYNTQRGYCSQRIRFEEGCQYSLRATGKCSGRTQGRMRIGVYCNEVEKYGLDWEDEEDWTTYEEDEMTFDVDELNGEVRIFSDDCANLGSYFWCDRIIVTRSKHYDNIELGNDITTTGTVDVIPDVMCTATRLTAGTTTEGFKASNIDSGAATVAGTTWTKLCDDMVYPAQANKRHRIDKLRWNHCSDDSGYHGRTRVTIQNAGLYGGAETVMCEYGSDYEYPNYEDRSHSPYLTCGENQACTIRWYGSSSDSGHSSHHRNMECDHTEVISNGLGTGIQIYNTADPLTVMQVCNKLAPGATMEINADGTGSFRYIEHLSDITYQSACYSRSGDSFNTSSKLLTLAVGGSVIYRFDTRYPITSIPYMVLDVISGNPQISIAAESSGTPGTYYAIDGNLTTDQTGQTIYRELNQAANLQLKGNTTFYVQITPYTSQNCVINSLYLYADLITIDAERPKIFATGQPNTFKVNMPNKTALEVCLQYRDAHRMI